MSGSQVHVRFGAQSLDYFQTDIGVDKNSSAADIKMKVAQQLDIGIAELDTYSVDFRPDGEITVHPQAQYG